MLILFSDFGLEGPYIGQVKAVLLNRAPSIPVIDLFSNAPIWDIASSSHLLANYSQNFPANCVFLSVVDPGVGGQRLAVVIKADDHWFVGPDNGLMDVIVSRSDCVEKWLIEWRPDQLSSSFHGRDLFAPIAAEIASGNFPEEKLKKVDINKVSMIDDLWRVIYIDHYGNAITGIRCKNVSKKSQLSLLNKTIEYANTFSAVTKSYLFWYCNSNGLVEIAANQDRASVLLDITIGTSIKQI